MSSERSKLSWNEFEDFKSEFCKGGESSERFSSETTSTDSNPSKVTLLCPEPLGKLTKTSRKHSEMIFSNLKFGLSRALKAQN